MTIREATLADAAGIARVHVDSWRTTYPGIMPQEHLDRLRYVDRERTWQEVLSGNVGEHDTFVAEAAGGEIVGFANGGKERSGDPDYLGEIYALYLLSPYQHHGIGGRLVQTLVRRLADLGYSTLLIWVNVHNSACRFYEALGGTVARTGQRTLSGVTYDDIGYGWDKAAFARLMGRE